MPVKTASSQHLPLVNNKTTLVTLWEGANTSAEGVDKQLGQNRRVALLVWLRTEGQCVQRQNYRQPVIDIQSQLNLRTKTGWFLPNDHNLKPSRW